MIKVVCAIVINTDKKVLLAQRSSSMDHKGMWEFPGGKVKDGESYHNAIEREIMEELNINIKAIETLSSVHWSYGKKNIELIPICCRLEGGEIELKEHAQVSWFTFSELGDKEDLLEADKEILKELVPILG